MGHAVQRFGLVAPDPPLFSFYSPCSRLEFWSRQLELRGRQCLKKQPLWILEHSARRLHHGCATLLNPTPLTDVDVSSGGALRRRVPSLRGASVPRLPHRPHLLPRLHPCEPGLQQRGHRAVITDLKQRLRRCVSSSMHIVYVDSQEESRDFTQFQRHKGNEEKVGLATQRLNSKQKVSILFFHRNLVNHFVQRHVSVRHRKQQSNSTKTEAIDEEPRTTDINWWSSRHKGDLTSSRFSKNSATEVYNHKECCEQIAIRIQVFRICLVYFSKERRASVEKKHELNMLIRCVSKLLKNSKCHNQHHSHRPMNTGASRGMTSWG